MKQPRCDDGIKQGIISRASAQKIEAEYNKLIFVKCLGWVKTEYAGFTIKAKGNNVVLVCDKFGEVLFRASGQRQSGTVYAPRSGFEVNVRQAIRFINKINS